MIRSLADASLLLPYTARMASPHLSSDSVTPTSSKYTTVDMVKPAGMAWKLPMPPNDTWRPPVLPGVGVTSMLASMKESNGAMTATVVAVASNTTRGPLSTPPTMGAVALNTPPRRVLNMNTPEYCTAQQQSGGEEVGNEGGVARVCEWCVRVRWSGACVC